VTDTVAENVEIEDRVEFAERLCEADPDSVIIADSVALGDGDEVILGEDEDETVEEAVDDDVPVPDADDEFVEVAVDHEDNDGDRVTEDVTQDEAVLDSETVPESDFVALADVLGGVETVTGDDGDTEDEGVNEEKLEADPDNVEVMVIDTAPEKDTVVDVDADTEADDDAENVFGLVGVEEYEFRGVALALPDPETELTADDVSTLDVVTVTEEETVGENVNFDEMDIDAVTQAVAEWVDVLLSVGEAVVFGDGVGVPLTTALMDSIAEVVNEFRDDSEDVGELLALVVMVYSAENVSSEEKDSEGVTVRVPIDDALSLGVAEATADDESIVDRVALGEIVTTGVNDRGDEDEGVADADTDGETVEVKRGVKDVTAVGVTVLVTVETADFDGRADCDASTDDVWVAHPDAVADLVPIAVFDK
jgi:hypothetical protein